MSRLANGFRSLYFTLFHRKALERYNDLILSCAIKARGYNNHENKLLSGEQYFIANILTKINPNTCVDVGANIGDYSRLLLEYTNARVFSFEPLNKPFILLSKIKELYGERLIPENKGVGDKIERKIIHFSNDNTEYASFCEETINIPYVKNFLTQEIEVVTLDSYFINRPDIDSIDFIKIDTEGFEYEVLSGATAVIETFRPKMIQIEHNWHHLFRSNSLYSFSVFLANYTPFQMMPDRLIRRNARDPYSNIYHFSNFVFIRNDISIEFLAD